MIGPAETRDATGLLSLRREVLGEGQWFITEAQELRGGLDAEIPRVRELSRSDNSLYLVARDEGLVVGFLVCTGGSLRRLRHTAKLEVMVRAAYRGKGIGSALLDEAIAWLDGHATVEKLGLAVFDDNERAIALYAARGFREEGRRPCEYRFEDGSYRGDVLMYRYRGGDTGIR